MLSMLSAATALIAIKDKHDPKFFNPAALVRIINSFLCWPEMESRALSTVSGRAIVLQVYEGLLVRWAWQQSEAPMRFTCMCIRFINEQVIHHSVALCRCTVQLIIFFR